MKVMGNIALIVLIIIITYMAWVASPLIGIIWILAIVACGGGEMTIKQIEEMKKQIKKAIEILGRPVMSYMPKIAMDEYDAKIKEAVNILLEILGSSPPKMYQRKRQIKRKTK